MRKLIISFSCVGLVLSLLALQVRAQDASPSSTPTPSTSPSADQQRMSDLQKTIDDLTQKLNNTRNQAQTLQSAINYINLKETLTQKQIEATQFQISLLQRDIDSLTGKIGVLEQSLNSLTSNLLHNVQEAYKHRDTSDLEVLLSSSDYGDMLSRYKYLLAVQQYRQDVLVKTTQTRFAYDQEKATKQQKQQTMADLQKKYQKQQQDLKDQENAKKLLLTQTRNDESNYQKLLSQALAEMNSLRGFSQSQGGVLLSSEQHSPDGWYYSQRDPRWGNMFIGGSRDSTILQVGCLLTDVAMVKKKYGENVTPMDIASNNSYFFSTTAYMLQPWPAPSGKHWERGSFDKGKVENDLRAGTPVIAHLRVNSRDGHFIVLKAMDGSNMIMHDPWEGYDKKFTDFYSTGQITDVSYLR